MTIPPPGPAKQLWACVHLTGCTRDKAALDPKGVAVLPGGAFHPPRRPAPNGDLPTERPGSKQGPISGNTEEPPGFLGKGDVMIHRPCLIAWFVRNPTPASVSIH